MVREAAAVMLAFIVGAGVVIILLSPVANKFICLSAKLLALGLCVIGVGGYIQFRAYDAQPSDINQIYIRYEQTLSFFGVVQPFVACGLAVYLGALAVAPLATRRIISSETRRTKVSLILPAKALWLAVVAVGAELIGVGPETLLNSSAYLSASGPSAAVSLESALLPVAIVVSANVAVGRVGAARKSAVLLLVCIEIILFGQGTRLFAVFFPLCAAGAWLTGRMRRTPQILLTALSVVLAIVLLGIPLALRARPSHGIVPSFSYLISDPGGLIGGTGLLANAFLGVPISLYIGSQVQRIPNSAFWVSINPAPSGLTNWSQVSPLLRLNVYEPYSAIGELLNQGAPVMIIIFASVGILLQCLTWASGAARSEVGAILQVALLGGAAVFLIRATQYNLRSDMRLLYYFTVLVCILVFAFRRNRASVGGSVARLGHTAVTWLGNPDTGSTRSDEKSGAAVDRARY